MKDIFIVTGRPVHALGPSPAEVLTDVGGSRIGDPPKAVLVTSTAFKGSRSGDPPKAELG